MSNLSDDQLFSKINDAVRKYRYVFKEFPKKIGIYHKRRASLHAEAIVFVDHEAVRFVEDISEGFEKPREYRIDIIGVEGSGATWDGVYFPHPSMTGMMIDGTQLIEQVKMRNA